MRSKLTDANDCVVECAVFAVAGPVCVGTWAGRSSGESSGGFTLFELLAVVALMAAVVTFAAMGLRGAGAGAARDGAVALLASRVAQARVLATSRGEPVRLLVCADTAQPERYLRFVVIAISAGSGWSATDAGSFLPAGAAILPEAPLPTSGPGAVRRDGDDWSRGSGGALRSTALLPYAENGTEPAVLGTTRWLMLRFSATGGTSSGDLVVANARRQDDSVPVTLMCERPDDVAGLSLSAYGVATFVRGRAEF